jgi:hypothetical protein
MGCNEIIIEGKTKKITTRKDGYQVISINRKIIYLHRFLAEKFIPNPNNYPCINHKDGNPSNNDFNNLEWCSYKQNLDHAKENNLWGDNILKKRKFDWEQIDYIRKRYQKGNWHLKAYI